MAEFDPNVQLTNDPSYTRDSRGVDIPSNIRPQGQDVNAIMPQGAREPDRSAEYLGKADAYAMASEGTKTKGLGDLFAGIIGIGDFVLKGADALIKQDIENKVYEIGKSEQALYLEQLENRLGLGSESGRRNLLDANASMDVPTDLEDLPAEVQTYADAKATRKLPEIYYTGRLMAEAKKLRAQHPGYKQYIDQQFVRATGMDPANARAQALAQSYASMQSSARSEQNKAMSMIMQRLPYVQNGINAQQAMTLVESGQWKLDDVISWATPGDAKKYELEMKALIRRDQQGTADQDKDAATKEAVSRIDSRVNTEVNLIQSKYGLRSVDDITQTMSTLNENGARALVRDIDVGTVKMRDALLKEMNEGGRRSIASLIGTKEVNNLIEERLKPWYELRKAVVDKDSGMIAETANYIKSLTNSDVKARLDSPLVGKFDRQLRVMRELHGDGPALQLAQRRIISRGYVGQDTAYWNSLDKEVSTQSGATERGKPVIYNDILEEYKRNGASDKTNMTKLINKVSDDLGNPDVPPGEKANIIISAFGPGNRGVISKLGVDGKDHQNRPVQGQWGTYMKWTSPSVAKGVWEASRTDFRLWSYFRNWSMETFANELVPRELNDMKNIVKEQDWVVEYTPAKEGGVPRFDLKRTITPEMLAIRGESYNKAYNEARSTIERINSGITGLHIIAKQENRTDIDGFLARLLSAGGGWGKEMTNAIFKSRKTKDADR